MPLTVPNVPDHPRLSPTVSSFGLLWSALVRFGLILSAGVCGGPWGSLGSNLSSLTPHDCSWGLQRSVVVLGGLWGSNLHSLTLPCLSMGVLMGVSAKCSVTTYWYRLVPKYECFYKIMGIAWGNISCKVKKRRKIYCAFQIFFQIS